jgi:cytoplasmic FMR1 interacting protein
VGGVREGAGGAGGEEAGWEQYRRVVADNYSAVDKAALLEVMCMIKRLSAEVQSLASALAPLLARNAHWSAQELALGTLAGFIIKMQSRGKTAMSALLLRMQHLAADWEGQNSREPLVPIEEANGMVKMATRESAPAPALLLILRGLVIKVRQRAAQNQGGYITKGELSPEKAGRLDDWSQASYAHELALNLPAWVNAVSDLSQLYFRELYLDMTKQVQFKLDLNLPHILASHVLSHRPGAADGAGAAGAGGARAGGGLGGQLVEMCLIALSIYDDAAACAVRDMRRRHMLLEIEEEAALCLEDVLEQLAVYYFRFFRLTAAAQLFPDKVASPDPVVRISALFAVKYVTVLGRPVLLAEQLSCRLSKLQDKALEYALLRFQATGLFYLDSRSLLPR